MAEITYFNLTDATERSTTSTSATEITQRTILWEDLTGAGFAASDVVFILWNFTLGGAGITVNQFANVYHGTTFAGATVFQSPGFRVEPDDVDSLNGHKHLGWLEQHTLVDGEDLYFALATANSGAACRSANFSCTVIKQADLGTDDYRWATGSGLDPTSTFATDATATLPSSGGDDWLIFGLGRWGIGSVNSNLQQRLQVGGTNVMPLVLEGEDSNEEFGLLTVYYHAAAGASDVINFQAAESSSGMVLDFSRILALRLEAFADHIGLYDTTTDSLSTTVDTYVETGTVSLSLSATGNVFVVGQTVVDVGADTVDPYLRIQEGGTDIVASHGRGRGRTRRRRGPGRPLGPARCARGR